jgi:hypothetical protein
MILERLENDTVLTPFSAFMLHPMNISSFISLRFILIYRVTFGVVGLLIFYVVTKMH